MKLLAQGKYWFTPKFNGNENLGEKERVQVEIIRPKAEERGELSYTEVTKSSGERISFKTGFNVSSILRNHVGGIKGLEIETLNDKAEPVSLLTGVQLAEASFYGQTRLIDEICAEVCSDVLTPTEKKTG